MTKRYHATLVSHTHWDRAWYCTFQEYRIRLVRLVDRLLALLEARPEYIFMLDGQTSILEDYLEVRPERAAALQALAQAGRISVGPWYVLPDEFLVSPEALIRNLMLGHRMGAPYGGVMKAGYVPDGFGHIAQLPQILRGFGIDSAFFWRGVGAEADHIGGEFEWVAKDGSRVTAVWMPWGYHNISNLGYPIRWGDVSQMAFDWDLAIAQIRDALRDLEPFAHTDAYLLMNGIDHAEAEPRIPEVIERAKAAIPDAEIVHGTLGDHLARVRASGARLPQFSGEFRWGRYSEVLQGVYSTRIYLKQVNHRVETLLERYTEPLTACAWLACATPPAGTQDLVWTAWRWLLKNHPHDDIYGSGIDEIHREMMYRFAQAEQIGRALTRDSLRLIAQQADFTAQPGTPVLVYNPLNWPRRAVAVGEIDFDFDDPTAGDFLLVDAQGAPVPHQVLNDEEAVWMETLKPNRKRKVRVAVPMEAPACGYTTLWAQPRSRRETPRAGGDWSYSARGAANRYLAFAIADDGGLTVTDKSTGAVYPDLHYFDDVDDAGDEYSYCPSPNREAYSTRSAPADIERIVEGPNAVSFRVSRTWRLPAGLTIDRTRRQRRLVSVPIVSTITLYRDQPGLYIETRIVNNAKDHKLTVAFPTDLRPEQAHVDAAFQVSARDIALPPSEGWVEDPTPLMHQRAFTDLSDGRRGLAVLNRGLPSVEVDRTEAGTSIALTLLRAVGWLSRDDLSNRRIAAGPLVPTPGAQCPGEHVFEYAILPHAGDWRAVYRAAYEYVTPLLVARADTHEGMELREMPFIGVDLDWYNQVARPIPWPRGGPNPPELSFFTLEPETLVLSAVRQSADGGGLVVRFYNIGDDEVMARLQSWRPLKAAHRLNLNEARLRQSRWPTRTR
ncbi:MAG: glycosyl hydrolase-related protein [Anaerolineae bacterium]|nr:glycosyl hydrolase-related protein [Anaerolineae bacterium]